MNILDEIAAKTKERVAERKEKISLQEIKAQAEQMSAETGFPFEEALGKKEISFICEVKKASPSKGLIAEHFPYREIARDYEAGGAGAISVLTEPYYFQGSDEYLKAVKETVSIPVLRKDFTVDEYMIYEAKVIGADAVLLICAILSDEELQRFWRIADGLGLTALVEAHDEEEVRRAMAIGARVIGVNNRDLKTFTVDIHNSTRFRDIVPKNILFVSESGIRNGDDIAELAKHDVNAVLIGETLMRADDRAKALQELREGAVR
ncbi:MAG: indole-3-glycerol phosphate synthase TrpC [Lachnospiraceae bacterium]|nr:indole-3-glycerol phosphate synthase TrpC [Lachnospiraceae bacterium]